MMVLFGRFHGRTPSTATSSPARRMMERSLSGRRRTDNGGSSRSMLIIKHRVCDTRFFTLYASANYLSVNSVQWAPHEVGAVLACASSDGKVSVLEFKDDGSWDTKVFQAHAIGCNAASWAPAASPGSIVQTTGSAPNAGGIRRFVTGGSDNLVKIWVWK